MNLRAHSHWRHPLKRAGLPLALFAIVFQALISFGHHHFYLSAARAAQDAAVAGSRVAQTFAPRGNRNNVPVVPTHKPCLVCVAIHASAPPVVDALPSVRPFDIDGAPVSVPAVASIAAPPRVAAFESRAPPLC